jgi:hypothetical protein
LGQSGPGELSVESFLLVLPLKAKSGWLGSAKGRLKKASFKSKTVYQVLEGDKELRSI